MTERESRSKQSGEPSVDDILESIRRIVFEEDDRAPGPGAGTSDAEAAAAEVSAKEVPAAEDPAAEVSAADVSVTDVPVADVPAADVPAAAVGRTGAEGPAQPAGKVITAEEPPPAVETASGEEAAGEDAAGKKATGEEAGAAEAAPPDDPVPDDPPPHEPQEPAPAEAQELGDPAAPSAGGAGGVGAEPGESVLLLTDMIAPDGSVVRLDPRPAEGPAAQDAPEAAGAGAGSGKGAGEGALDPATQSELTATVREWLDRNAPELVDRAARRELQKLSERQD